MSYKKWRQASSANKKPANSAKVWKLTATTILLSFIISALIFLLYVNAINSSKQKVINDSIISFFDNLLDGSPVGIEGSVSIYSPENKDLESVHLTYSGKTERGILADSDAIGDVELVAKFNKKIIKLYPKLLKKDDKLYIKFDDIKYSLEQLSAINPSKFSGDGINLLTERLKGIQGQWIDIDRFNPRIITPKCLAAVESSKAQALSKEIQKKISETGFIDLLDKSEDQKIKGRENFHFHLSLGASSSKNLTTILPDSIKKECQVDAKSLTSGITKFEFWVDKSNHRLTKVLMNIDDSGVSSTYTLSFKNDIDYKKINDIKSIDSTEAIKSIEDVLGTQIKNVL